ncbi:PIN domain-containing protein [Streptomyces sp. NPDC005395]|uniref:PIN domain-containing protein n=1 Tax=Streptomyces sp. NPDC005395 TaxID=3157042 RepID=UPI0033AE2688
MIILDTSILRSFGPESSSADLLHTISKVGSERVGAPWMVLEELAAQQAIKYQEMHERTAQALEALRHATPWGALDVKLGYCDTERVRKHWRTTWSRVVEVIPTSDKVLRKALFREANCLAPCKEAKSQKTGSRDAAIWLSAVEYAMEHPDETVYFVSANTRDFGDGTSYSSPMDKDVADVGDRFVLLTSMDEVVARFTEPAEVNEARVTEMLSAEGVLQDLRDRADELLLGDAGYPDFDCTIPTAAGLTYVAPAQTWMTVRAYLGSVEQVQAYRIGSQEWCTASVDWRLIGMVRVGFGAASAAVSWSTRVLFRLDEPTNPNILRGNVPSPVSGEVAAAVGVPPMDVTQVELAVGRAKDRAWELSSPRYRSERFSMGFRIGEAQRRLQSDERRQTELHDD